MNPFDEPPVRCTNDTALDMLDDVQGAWVELAAKIRGQLELLVERMATMAPSDVRELVVAANEAIELEIVAAYIDDRISLERTRIVARD